MAKPRWQKILDAEDAARRASGQWSDEAPPPLPAGSVSRPDPALAQMAGDLREIRRKQSIDFYVPGIALLVLLGGIYWFLHA
jgi:hypothetical protein